MSESTEFEVVPPMAPIETPSDTPELNPRNAIMARIAARREEQIAADNAQAKIYDDDATEAGLNFARDEPEPAPQPSPVVAPQREAVTSPAPVLAPETPQQPQVRFVEVDGHQYAVTKEQEDALLRMGMMANTALHQYQAQPQSFAPAPIAPEPTKPIIDPDSIRDTVRSLQYSGEDDAAEKLTNLITSIVSRTQAPQIDQNAIVTRAVAEARAQAQLASDAQVIQQEYPDIFEHPMRAFLAKTNVDVIRQTNIATGRRMSDLEVYREAGNAVREAMNLPTPTQAPQQQPAGVVAASRQDVIERKRNAPRGTQPIDMRSPAPTQVRAPSNSDIVEMMRKARGQSSMR